MLGHLDVATRLLFVPRTRIPEMFGEFSSGERGVSSNCVVGVSGISWTRACWGFSGKSDICLNAVWDDLVPRLGLTCWDSC